MRMFDKDYIWKTFQLSDLHIGNANVVLICWKTFVIISKQTEISVGWVPLNDTSILFNIRKISRDENYPMIFEF